MDWSKYEIRDENPIADADKVSIDNNRIKRIFKQKIENDDNYKKLLLNKVNFLAISSYYRNIGYFFRQI